MPIQSRALEGGEFSSSFPGAGACGTDLNGFSIGTSGWCGLVMMLYSGATGMNVWFCEGAGSCSDSGPGPSPVPTPLP